MLELPTAAAKKLSSLSQREARKTDGEFEADIASARDKILLDTPHVARNTGEFEWYTPPHIVEAARACMGGIDLDPASSDAANKFIKADRYFTEADDGLSRDWSGRVWMNPPYSKELIAPFIEKLLSSNLNQACALTHNATETSWGQALLGAASAVCFPSGRIGFIDPATGTPRAGSPLQGQMIVGLDVTRGCFDEAFGEIGTVLSPDA